MAKKIKIPKVRCKLCGYKWSPNVSAPKKCPECQSRSWDQPIEVRRPSLVGAYKSKKKR